MIILSPLVIVDSMCLKKLNLNENHLLLLSINILKHPPITLIPKLLVIVAEVLVITVANALANRAINLVLTQVQTCAQHIITTTPPKTILHIMIATDLAMTNLIETLLHGRIILLVHITNIPPFVAHIHFTLVLVKAPQVIITPQFDAIIHNIISFSFQTAY